MFGFRIGVRTAAGHAIVPGSRFHPLFVHQSFGEDERISGIAGLAVHVTLSDPTLHVLVACTHQPAGSTSTAPPLPLPLRSSPAADPAATTSSSSSAPAANSSVESDPVAALAAGLDKGFPGGWTEDAASFHATLDSAALPECVCSDGTVVARYTVGDACFVVKRWTLAAEDARAYHRRLESLAWWLIDGTTRVS